jgi:hypothetical protein
MKKLLLLAPALLLAGCRGEQVAFQFQPATSLAVATRPAPATATAPITADTLAHPASLATPRAARVATPPRHQARLAPLAPALARVAAPTFAAERLAQRFSRRHATEGQAESGLGNIGLFVIAVVLGILAGLAALVNLIFSVGFFTALGYTAAGLVVLFLLYSLLSGGKKKK